MPSSNEERTTRFQLQHRWLLATICAFGISSWIALGYAIKDVEIVVNSNKPVVVHEIGLYASVILGTPAVIATIVALVFSLKASKHRLLRLAGYTVLGWFMSYPALAGYVSHLQF